jgi:hypothetical protein
MEVNDDQDGSHVSVLEVTEVTSMCRCTAGGQVVNSAWWQVGYCHECVCGLLSVSVSLLCPARVGSVAVTAVTAAQWGDEHVWTHVYCSHATAVGLAEWPEQGAPCTWACVTGGMIGLGG